MPTKSELSENDKMKTSIFSPQGSLQSNLVDRTEFILCILTILNYLLFLVCFKHFCTSVLFCSTHFLCPEYLTLQFSSHEFLFTLQSPVQISLRLGTPLLLRINHFIFDHNVTLCMSFSYHSYHTLQYSYLFTCL